MSDENLTVFYAVITEAMKELVFISEILIK